MKTTKIQYIVRFALARFQNTSVFLGPIETHSSSLSRPLTQPGLKSNATNAGYLVHPDQVPITADTGYLQNHDQQSITSNPGILLHPDQPYNTGVPGYPSGQGFNTTNTGIPVHPTQASITTNNGIPVYPGQGPNTTNTGKDS